ncbi:MAG: hypothetical protein R2771_02475 [Saprospiraceae bacterium]
MESQKKIYQKNLPITNKAITLQNSAYLDFYLNTLNDKFFPSDGNYIKFNIFYNFLNKIKLKYEVDEDNYDDINSFPELNLQWRNYKKINKKIVWSKEIICRLLLWKFYNEKEFFK